MRDSFEHHQRRLDSPRRDEVPGESTARRRHTGDHAAESRRVTSVVAPGQEPADPRRVVAALQNLAAIERLIESSGAWQPLEDDPLAQQLRNLALAGILELHPFEIPGEGGERRYRPTVTVLGSRTVFDVLSVARSR